MLMPKYKAQKYIRKIVFLQVIQRAFNFLNIKMSECLSGKAT